MESWDSTSHDVLELGAGLNPGNVQLFWTRQYHLRVVLPDGGQIVVEQQATGAGPGIEAIRFADGTQWNLDAIHARAAITTDGDDDLVLGTRDDVVDGGAGNDQFHNLGGYDTFLFGLGDGHDVINETSGALRFKDGLLQDGVRFAFDGRDLVATLKASGESVRLKNWTVGWSRITSFEFTNGTVLNTQQVWALAGAGDDLQLLFGSPNDDTLTATGPRAVIHGGGGNDTLSGGVGDDDLYGEAGDDVLDGGAGNDTLQGGAGRNTYVMRRGMGLDTAITESLATAQDLVVLPEGVRPQDITVGLQLSGHPGAVADENSLFDRVVIGIGQNDALVIRGFDPVSYQDLDVMQQAAQTFRFSDGTELTLTELLALSNPGRLGEHYLGGQSAVDIWGSAGNDDIVEWYGHAPTRRVGAGDNNDRVSVGRNDHLVSGGWGNDDIDAMGGQDVVAGDAGDDVIDTGSQDDVVLFNRGDGNDRVDFGTGTDTLSFGAGIAPEDLSVALSSDGDWLILVDGGAGGSVQVRPIDFDDPTQTASLRLQFIGATGEARVFDLSAWVRQHLIALQATSTGSALLFDGAGVEITAVAAMAGGLAAVAHAQTGDLFGTATLVRALPSEANDWIHGTDGADVINAGAGNDHVMGHGGNDVLLGGSGDDVLYGGEGDDVLEGGEGNDQLLGGVSDRLIGGAGHDQLFGLGGADRLAGGVGSDTYHVQASATPEKPTQTVIAEVWRPQDINVLSIDGEVTSSDLWLTLDGDDLVLHMGPSGDSVRFVGFDPRVPGMQAPVARIELLNAGEVVEFADLMALGVHDPQAEPQNLVVDVGDGPIDIDTGSAAYTAGSLTFGAGVDPGALRSSLTFEADGLGGHWLVMHYGQPGDVLRLSGFTPEAVLDGGHTIDRFEFANGLVWDHATLVSEGFVVEGDGQPNALSGTNLVDRLHGGDGDDVLVGGAGSDELLGGRGDDQLSGGEGDDAYVFQLGDGVDTIIDSGATDFNFIRFGASIRPEDIREEWDGNTLVVRYSEADAVRIADYHGTQGNPAILALVFEDGSVLSLTERMNRAPEVAGRLEDATAVESAEFQMVVPDSLFRDPDAADELRLSVRQANGDPLPAWLSFDAERRTLSGRPASDNVGVIELLVEARDHFGATVSTGFSLNVTGVRENQAPVAINDSATLLANASEPTTGNVLLNDTDPDGDTLSLLKPGVQRGMLGVIGWQADGSYTYVLNDLLPEVRALGEGQSATERLAYTATDGQDSAQGELVITVEGVNDAPTSRQALGDVLVIKKKTSTWQLPANAFTDPDQDDSLSYSAALVGGAPLPDWLVFDAATRSFVAQPPAHARGELSVEVTATDLHGASASQVFEVAVGNPGDKPKGNQGVGNGEDPPPHGHDTNFNDGPGTGPGNPGASTGERPQAVAPAGALQTPAEPIPIALVDWAAWDTPHEAAVTSTASTPSAAEIEHHWQQLLATLQQLDAERSASDPWDAAAGGAAQGLSGLTAGGQTVGLAGASAIGLTAGSGTHLTSFNGLKEGLASLAA